MMLEMQNTLNAIGDYSDTEDEDTDNETTKTAKAVPSASTTAPDEASPRTTQPGEKKKKKKKKSKGASKKQNLEDYMNANALDVAEDPYDTSKSVAERVELAVTRFRKNRKFDPKRGQIFSVYLDYGGIKTGQKSFQGGGVATGGANDDGEPDFEAMNVGIDRVEEPDDDQTVDFENVATTFLSEFFLKYSGWIEAQYYTDTPLVVAALMNYLLVRNVLPEHEDDVKRALAVAEKAKDELPRIKAISKHVPGRFDKACSLIYGGEFHGILNVAPGWNNSGWGEVSQMTEAFGMDMPFAERLVKSLLGKGQELSDITVQPREYMEMEIVQVDLPSGDSTPVAGSISAVGELGEIEAQVEAMVDQLFTANVKAADPTQAGKEGVTNTEGQSWPLPKLACVTFAEWDYEQTREGQLPVERRRKVKAYFEKPAAEAMLSGMRASAYVYAMSNGMSYLEQACFYPTFYLEADRIEVDDWDEEDDM
ncbi:MAG: Argonaute complex, subunit Arb1 [Podila humilis]|nr:MAG: Argonaute complex, subunit Arb1 [Podila humilis]